MDTVCRFFVRVQIPEIQNSSFWFTIQTVIIKDLHMSQFITHMKNVGKLMILEIKTH